MNKWKEERERCEKIIALCPNYAEAYNNLAIVYDKQNDYANALKNYAKAVNLQPDYVIAHHNLGLFFLKHGKFNEALKQFNNVIQLNPNILTAHYHLGNLYLGKNKLDLAEEQYMDVLTEDPEHSDTLSNMGVICLKKGNPQLAIDYFTKALAFDNHHQDAKSNLAATFMVHDRYENAIRHYLELLSDAPDDMEYHYNIAVAYMNLGHLNDAMVHFDIVLENHSNHAASLNNLAAIYWRLGDTKKAEEFFTRALAIEPENTTSRYMLTALTHQNNADYNQQGAPAEYVKNLFDNYAIQYDEHLCQQLQYQLPEKIGEWLKKYQKKFEKMLDLGCGTGLMGQYLKSYGSQLCGVDLSQKMLNNAEKTGFYDELFCDEIIHFLSHSEYASETWDCICATEVFEYFGDLNKVFQCVSTHLDPKGIFIFSIEMSEEKTFILQDTARFAHNPSYVKRVLEQYHLNILEQTSMIVRLQNHQPLSSALFVVRKML